ncbi:carboxymuconolactone decarboxylase family protein [Marinococcus luteus]|uniref:carboxymuconolactone decarboxylase family protein n=1 Tax=Marinococcus luteus TaxID=1122204 RepID=UPI002ACD16A9|nr:carboxymuconolactone decarboxylase family protein [Marinococcus luteus]MDZ5783585.1 carboxymuconolactone decarboxylase family protein [Marinococcus luteus]
MAVIDAKEILSEYRRGIEQFSESYQEIAKNYNRFTSSAFEGGEVSTAQKHLTALAIGVHQGDTTCIVYHMDQCLHHGCSEDEIKEYMGVAAAFGGGESMSEAVTIGLDALQQLKDK